MLNILELSNSTDGFYLSQGVVTWRAVAGNFDDYDIYSYDGSQNREVTNNDLDDNLSNSLGSRWVGYNYNRRQDQYNLIYYNGTALQEVASSGTNFISPLIAEDRIAWEAEDNNDSEVFFYDGQKVRQLTNNGTEDSLRAINDRYIVWTSLDRRNDNEDIFIYKDGETQQLTYGLHYTSNYPPYDGDSEIEVSGDKILWNGSFDGLDNEIFLYNGNNTVQLTDDNLNQSRPLIDGNNIVWTVEEGSSYTHHSDLFLYDGIQTRQLNPTVGFILNLEIQGNYVVWSQENYVDSQYNGTFLYNIAQGQVSRIAGSVARGIKISVDNIALSASDGNDEEIYIYNIPSQSTFQLTDNDFSDSNLQLEGNQLAWLRDGRFLNLATWQDDLDLILTKFAPAQYAASYPDLIEAIGYNPQALEEHYRQFGYGESRSLDRFDEFRYVASYGDLIAAFGTRDTEGATRHYVINGYRERRDPNQFNAEQYLASNSDLINLYRSNLQGAERHYIESGYSEGRSIDSFNGLSYLAANRDLIQAFGLNTTAAVHHYVYNGYGENRSVTFDADRYLASNPDLITALGGDRTLATLHYIQSGYDEGRPTKSFSSSQYLASNRDLYNAFGTDYSAATTHFVNTGYQEGRSLDNFDEYRYIASNIDLTQRFQYAVAYPETYSGYPYFIDVVEQSTDHYLRYGIPAGLPTTSFNPFAYMAIAPDVAMAVNNDPAEATKRYIAFGWQIENNFHSSTFDSSEYLASNSDLIPVLQGNRGAATRHYINAGYAEGRSTDSFSPRQYLASNLDLLRVFAVNYTAATDHFVDTGYRENRNTDTFDEYRYIASNPADLISAFSNPDLGIIDGEEATDHYLRHGIGEGRSTTSFDPLAYMTANPDVALGVNNNPLEATKHYILFGYEEGRAIA